MADRHESIWKSIIARGQQGFNQCLFKYREELQRIAFRCKKWRNDQLSGKKDAVQNENGSKSYFNDIEASRLLLVNSAGRRTSSLKTSWRSNWCNFDFFNIERKIYTYICIITYIIYICILHIYVCMWNRVVADFRMSNLMLFVLTFLGQLIKACYWNVLRTLFSFMKCMLYEIYIGHYSYHLIVTDAKNTRVRFDTLQFWPGYWL